MRNSVGCLLVFDISQRQTFDRIRSWQEEVLDYVKPNPMIFLLVGHKCDMDVQRQVTKEEAESLAKKLNMLGYLEVSSRDNTNVSLAFQTLAKGIYDHFQKRRISIREGWYGFTVGAPIQTEPPQTKKSGCQCG